MRAKYEGFEDAVVGVGIQFNREIMIYDYEKCVVILMERDGMTRDEADEYMEYNYLGAWIGDTTPVFMMMEGDDE
jgi:hypothetical protein